MNSLPNGNFHSAHSLLAECHGSVRRLVCEGEREDKVNEATSRSRTRDPTGSARSGEGGAGRSVESRDDPRATLDENFRRTVLAHLKRSRRSASQLGRLALGDPDFVCRLGKGRSISLRTADRVLRFMGEATIGPMFRREVEAFIRVTGTGRANLGHKAAGDPGFVSRLKNGSSLRLSTVQQVRAWMRGIASDAERAAIARAIAGGEEVAPALAPDPAALGALAEAPDFSAGGDPCVAVCDQPAFLTTRQAAAYLTLSPRTLDRYRGAGKGPAFHKFETRIAYARADLEEWARARRKRRPVSRG